jgi:hypothetical protein
MCLRTHFGNKTLKNKMKKMKYCSGLVVTQILSTMEVE